MSCDHARVSCQVSKYVKRLLHSAQHGRMDVENTATPQLSHGMCVMMEGDVLLYLRRLCLLRFREFALIFTHAFSGLVQRNTLETHTTPH